MIIITRHGVTEDKLDHIPERVEALGLRTHLIRGEVRTAIGLVGDHGGLAKETLLSIQGVEEVHSVMKPYKLVSRQFSVEPTQVPLGEVKVGGDALWP
jgi:3-deoxy-7-phosphoheptulonate synthase